MKQVEPQELKSSKVIIMNSRTTMNQLAAQAPKKAWEVKLCEKSENFKKLQSKRTKISSD